MEKRTHAWRAGASEVDLAMGGAMNTDVGLGVGVGVAVGRAMNADIGLGLGVGVSVAVGTAVRG